VTDANVVLGYLPENLLGGTFKLDREGAKKRCADHRRCARHR
jgi:N-methylhydantoinase A